MASISSIDAKEWAYKLKQKNILQFEYKDLPKEFKDIATLHRAKHEGFITSLGKNGNGINVWRINDNIDKRNNSKKRNNRNNDNKLINKGENKQRCYKQ